MGGNDCRSASFEQGISSLIDDPGRQFSAGAIICSVLKKIKDLEAGYTAYVTNCCK